MSRIGDSELDKVKEAFDLNLHSQIDLVRIALPALRSSKGKVLAVTSALASIPTAGWAPYCASKAALNIYLQTLAIEEPELSACVALDPGVVETQMVQEVRGKGRSVFEERQWRGFEKFWAGMVKPEEPANAAAKILLSEGKNECNGKVVKYTQIK